MQSMLFKYRITYADGQVRYCPDSFTASINVTDEEYLQIIQGVADGCDIMDIEGLEDVVSRMKARAEELDPHFTVKGTWRNQPLKTLREIADVEVFLDLQFVTHIRSYKDPISEMTRPEQAMTVYRSDGSSVEITYRQGKITYRDSRKKGQTCVMTADTFLSWVVH